MSADVDAARYALLVRLEAVTRKYGVTVPAAVWRDDIDAFEAAIRAEVLDVERLAMALDVDWSPAWHELPIEERSGVGMVAAGWDKRELAVIVAAEYARLAKDAER